jgi:hypothetical protein
MKKVIVASIYILTIITSQSLWAQMPSFTQPANFEDVPVYRLQVKLTTGRGPDYQTDDRVFVTLNASMQPYYLDNASDDREQGRTDVHDIIDPTIRKISDIKQLNITKAGTDGWSLSQVQIVVNGKTIFTHTPNKILDGDGGKSPILNYTSQQLRSAGRWSYAQNVGIHIPPLTISKSDLREMIEGYMGNYMRYIPNATVNWGSTSGINTRWGDAVELKTRNTQTLEVDLDLQVSVTGPNAELDVNFEFVVNCTNGKVELSIQNAKASLNYLSRINIDRMRLNLSKHLNRSFNVPICRAKFNPDGSLSFI